MAVKTTTLSFSTTNQSLWAPGEAEHFRISTGDLLVYTSPELSKHLDADIGVAGFSGDAYLSFKVGLEAYAELVNAGNFGAKFDIDVRVAYPSAVDISQSTTMNFALSKVAVRSATIESDGFDGSPGAGIDFIIQANAGLRNIEYFAFGYSGDKDDLTLIDIDERIPIIEIRPTTEITGELYPGIELTARLPTLTGGNGLDSFRFLVRDHAADAVTDFLAADDTLVFEDSAFDFNGAAFGTRTATASTATDITGADLVIFTGAVLNSVADAQAYLAAAAGGSVNEGVFIAGTNSGGQAVLFHASDASATNSTDVDFIASLGTLTAVSALQLGDFAFV